MRSNPRVEEPSTSARELARGALASLEQSRRRIDDLNVYPVPDGDTGTNLTLTARAIVEALEQSTATERAAIAKELTRAALMGARGTRGDPLADRPRLRRSRGQSAASRRRDPGEAFRSASDAAYRAVRKPVEGTMLTVIRELAEAAERSSVEDVELLVELVRAGEESVRGTTEKLDVLRHGRRRRGRRRWSRSSAGSRPPRPESRFPRRRSPRRSASRRSTRSCPTTATARRSSSRATACREEIESELEPLGDSLLVVGDADAVKVHVHTDEPGDALGVGTKRGTIGGVEIANMHLQTVSARSA